MIFLINLLILKLERILFENIILSWTSVESTRIGWNLDLRALISTHDTLVVR